MLTVLLRGCGIWNLSAVATSKMEGFGGGPLDYPRNGMGGQGKPL